MINDSLSDMIIRIKNALAAGKSSVSMPMSNDKVRLAAVLKANRYIADYKTIERKPANVLEIAFDTGNTKHTISHFRRVSKPSRRVYVKSHAIPRPLSGYGLTIMSTPKGVMSGRDAQEAGLGGEVLAIVW